MKKLLAAVTVLAVSTAQADGVGDACAFSAPICQPAALHPAPGPLGVQDRATPACVVPACADMNQQLQRNVVRVPREDVRPHAVDRVRDQVEFRLQVLHRHLQWRGGLRLMELSVGGGDVTQTWHMTRERMGVEDDGSGAARVRRRRA